jgi:hypothetical protein
LLARRTARGAGVEGGVSWRTRASRVRGAAQVPFSRHADTFFYDLETDEWVQPTIAGKAPGYRYGCTAVTTAAQVLMWGGWEAGRSLNEFVVLDLTGLTGGGAAGAPSSGDGEGEGDGGAGRE